MSINIPTAYKSSITIPWGDLDNTIEWCKTNCTCEWKFEEAQLPYGDYRYRHKSENYYNFYFESERDYFAFIMWKK